MTWTHLGESDKLYQFYAPSLLPFFARKTLEEMAGDTLPGQVVTPDSRQLQKPFTMSSLGSDSMMGPKPPSQAEPLGANKRLSEARGGDESCPGSPILDCKGFVRPAASELDITS